MYLGAKNYIVRSDGYRARIELDIIPIIEISNIQIVAILMSYVVDTTISDENRVGHDTEQLKMKSNPDPLLIEVNVDF